jgi:hypothetical protein
MKKTEAQTKYLEAAKALPLYGVTMFDVVVFHIIVMQLV